MLINAVLYNFEEGSCYMVLKICTRSSDAQYRKIISRERRGFVHECWSCCPLNSTISRKNAADDSEMWVMCAVCYTRCWKDIHVYGACISRQHDVHDCTLSTFSGLQKTMLLHSKSTVS